jgi:hypothetical protein
MVTKNQLKFCDVLSIHQQIIFRAPLKTLDGIIYSPSKTYIKIMC